MAGSILAITALTLFLVGLLILYHKNALSTVITKWYHYDGLVTVLKNFRALSCANYSL